MHAQKGFIFILTLLLLQIVVIFGWIALKGASLQNKLTGVYWNSTRYQLVMDSVLNGVIRQSLTVTLPCVIHKTPVEALLQHPLTWWQSPVTCQEKRHDLKFYYVLEELGPDACADIEGERLSKVAEYGRLTVLLLVKDHTMQIEQATFVKPVEIVMPCPSGQHHTVYPGVQSKRILPVSNELESNVTATPLFYSGIRKDH